VAGFANDAIENGIVSSAAAAAVLVAPLGSFSGASLLTARVAVIAASTFDTSLGLDVARNRKPNYVTAADRTIGAVTGEYIGGQCPGSYPVYGSQTFYPSMVSGAHAQNALIKETVNNGVSIVGQQLSGTFNLSAVLTAIAGVIAAFSNHK
jgi:hypothetical protein